MTPTPIHPYDFYELISDTPMSEVIEVGKMDEPITFPSGESYVAKRTIWRINGTEYVETTTAPVVTKAFEMYEARK